ncbi:MAG: hypothetical protein ACJ77K_03005 [Bacteroidia bacterium]
MKKSVLSTTAFALMLFISTTGFSQKKTDKNKFLEGRKFNVQFYEIKSTGRGKAQPTLLMIKGGKIEADLMYEKLSLDPVPYRVTLDSTYTEDETEMHMVTLEGDWSKDKADYHWEATVINYDVEGTVSQSKNGVEKKKYEFSGSEKPKKK